MPEQEIGQIMAFFARPVVAGIQLTGPLAVGDQVRIHGHTTNITMVVESMQLDNAPIQQAVAGQAIGLKVPDRVREGDLVYRVTS